VHTEEGSKLQTDLTARQTQTSSRIRGKVDLLSPTHANKMGRDGLMMEPIRAGNRGGAADFKWSDVSKDKDREVLEPFVSILAGILTWAQNYLGHSINAPTGRWQKNKDVHWYNRDKEQTEAERAEEMKRIKAAEAEVMAVAL
jgi:hypothetical protein